MKNIIILILLLLFIVGNLSAQKNDYSWVVGFSGNMANGSILDFNYSPVKIKPNNAYLNFYWFADSNICDSLGVLQFYTNGVNILNAQGEIIEGGYHIFNCDSTSLNNYRLDGCLFTSSIMTLPLPDVPNQYINIMGKTIFWDVPGQQYQNGGFSPLFYNLIDMHLNGGKGKIIESRKTTSKDTFNTGLTAVRHANGKDWWILAQKAYSNIFTSLLLDREGIHTKNQQKGGVANSYMDAAFSPDGTIYAGIVNLFKTNYNINIFKFDRCSGLFNDTLSFHFNNDIPGKLPDFAFGIAISLNSRFLYITSAAYIYQYDLQSKNIQNSRLIIGVYDGYLENGVDGANTYFGYPRLAPDGKIYISTYGGLPYFHVIENPDSLGINCNLIQRAIKLPSYNRTVPNYPYFRLGASKTPCTTAVSETQALKIKIYPNPTSGTFNLSFDAPLTGVAELKIYDLVGRLVKSLSLEAGAMKWSEDVSGLAPGAYICILTEDKVKVWSGKLAIIK